jgi:hypothetical protein
MKLPTAFAFWMAGAAFLHAQFPGAPPGPPRSPRESARIDITGYWVSVVTEDWRFRMFTPPKGDYPNVPLNPAGRKLADAWDPANDEADDRCKAYGAANIMRVPGRLHITWADDSTLKIDYDAGMQTRLLRFGAPPAPARATRQGHSVASWQGRGSLRVDTTKMLPGYLQYNGVPYSGSATMTEDFDVVKEPNGDQWLIVNATVTDPTYLMRSFIRSTNFRKEADASGWKPTPCFVR